MSDLGRLLDDMTIRALSPDKLVRAQIRGRGMPVVSFAKPDAFERYRRVPGALSSQVSAVIERAMEGVDTGRRQLIADHSSLGVDDRPHWNAERRQLRERIGQLKLDVSSGGDLFRVETVGLRRWQVLARPGALEKMTADQFCTELNGAIQEANRRYLVEMRRLKQKALGRLMRSAG